LYMNGANLSEGVTFTSPSFSVAGDEVFVLCHTAALVSAGGGIPDAQCDMAWASLNFNGDDAIVLSCGSPGAGALGISISDVFGQVGLQPPSGQWQGAINGTKDTRLERDCSIIGGDVIYDDLFDPDDGWASEAADYFEGLGEGCGTATGGGEVPGPSEGLTYTENIQPILLEHCAGCHPGFGGPVDFVNNYADISTAASHGSCPGQTIGECIGTLVPSQMPMGAAPGSFPFQSVLDIQQWVSEGFVE